VDNKDTEAKSKEGCQMSDQDNVQKLNEKLTQTDLKKIRDEDVVFDPSFIELYNALVNDDEKIQPCNLEED
jgi:hypothetical protein